MAPSTQSTDASNYFLTRYVGCTRVGVAHTRAHQKAHQLLPSRPATVRTMSDMVPARARTIIECFSGRATQIRVVSDFEPFVFNE